MPMKFWNVTMHWKTIWVDDNYFNAAAWMYISLKLRKLLKDDPGIEIINIHGKGYKLITPSGEEQVKDEGIQVLWYKRRCPIRTPFFIYLQHAFLAILYREF